MSEGQIPSNLVPGIPLLSGIGPKPGTPRGGLPYIWVTWLTRLLAGSNQCLWAPWFKARNRYEKVEDPDFKKAEWTAQHTALVQQTAAALTEDGYTCRIENQNAFRLKGTGAILGGKPDIIAFRVSHVLIVDAKSGGQHDSDWWQVLVYLFAVPLAFKDDCQGRTITGMVAYKPVREGERPRMVPVPELSADRRADIVKMLHSVGKDAVDSPKQVPSQAECRFCDIGKQDCDQRSGEGAGVDIFTSEF